MHVPSAFLGASLSSLLISNKGITTSNKKLLVPRCMATSSKKLLVAKGITTRSFVFSLAFKFQRWLAHAMQVEGSYHEVPAYKIVAHHLSIARVIPNNVLLSLHYQARSKRLFASSFVAGWVFPYRSVRVARLLETAENRVDIMMIMSL